MSSDKQATTYGDTECGGASAACALSAPACFKPSATLTDHAEEGADCNGNSDEFNDSPVAVVCFAVGAGKAAESLCDYDPRLCRVSLDPALADCLETAAPHAALLSLIDGMLNAAYGKPLLSFVAFEVTGDQVIALWYSDGTCDVETTSIA